MAPVGGADESTGSATGPVQNTGAGMLLPRLQPHTPRNLLPQLLLLLPLLLAAAAAATTAVAAWSGSEAAHSAEKNATEDNGEEKPSSISCTKALGNTVRVPGIDLAQPKVKMKHRRRSWQIALRT